MAMGPRDQSSLVMLTGWDATELQNFALQDGTTFDTVVATLNMAMGGLNSEIYNDPLWSGLTSYTDQPDLEYRVGSSNGFEDHTEYGRPDPKRATTEGHMLPYREYDRALAWTWGYLRRARMSQIEADIADVVKDAKDKWRVKLLTRLLQRGDDSGAVNGLGSSGYSAGFATAAASTSVDFVPPAHGGNTFTSADEHYVGIAGGAFTNAVFSDAKAELMEHGHLPPYDFIIGTSDEIAVKALTDFVETASSLISYGASTALATFTPGYSETGNYAIGTAHDFRIWVVPGMPQYYGFGWKSYGPNSQRNPLRVRLFSGQQTPMFTIMKDPKSGSGVYPLEYAMSHTGFGVGVADRTNGTARYVNNTTWADGTPT